MSEEANNQSNESIDPTNQISGKIYTIPIPLRIRFVARMNKINAYGLILLGVLSLPSPKKTIPLLIFISSIIMWALGHYLAKMNKIVWILNIVLFSFTAIVLIAVIARVSYVQQYSGSVTYNVCLLIYCIIIDYCIVSSWKKFFK